MVNTLQGYSHKLQQRSYDGSINSLIIYEFVKQMDKCSGLDELKKIDNFTICKLNLHVSSIVVAFCLKTEQKGGV